MFLACDDIDDDLARNVITWILEENLRTEDTPAALKLIVNSSGGSVTAGFAIIDAMRGSAIPVHTVALGQIASMGLMVFMAGHRGTRLLTPNTSILSHQWAWGSRGKEHELIATTREFDLVSARIVSHYKKCTGLKEKAIRERLLPPHDVWLSAEEALALGVCDRVATIG